MLSSIFSFFKRNAVKVTSTDKGYHENHWYTLFPEKTEQAVIIDRLNKSLESGRQYLINQKIYLIDHPLARTLSLNGQVLTGFPHWRGSEYVSIETIRISEWSQTKGWEASISARHESGCCFSFFAVDYVYRKQKYKANKHIEINLVGLVYVLHDCDITTLNNDKDLLNKGLSLADDFCGYNITEGLDDIAFIGIIEAYREHTIDDIDGFVIRMKLTPSLSIEAFIAKTHLTIELVVGKQIGGVLWLIGSLKE